MNQETKDRFVLGEVDNLDALIGTVERSETKPHHCTYRDSCPDPSHRRDPRVFLDDRRPGTPHGARHEGPTWICYYCCPTRDLLEAYERRNGVQRRGPFGLSALKVVHWPGDKINVLVGAPRSMIGHTFLAWETA